MKVQLMVLVEDLDHQRKSLILVLLKQMQNFVWACIIIFIVAICLLIEKKFKGNNKNIYFPTWFCLGSTSDGFSATESR